MFNCDAFCGASRGIWLPALVLLWSLFFLFIGCQVTGSFQGLYAYRHEVDSCSWLVPHSEFDCHLSYGPESKVAIVRGEHLLKCLRLNGDRQAVLYLWQPNCSSKSCFDLNFLQGLADSAGLTLYVVAEYYDRRKMEENLHLQFPILGLDTEYYGSERTKIYVRLFFEELGVDYAAYDQQSFFFYSGGDLQYASDSMVP